VEEDEQQRQSWLNSEHYRVAMRQLADDMQDAREATQRAYIRAQREEQKAQEALESARRNALLLDGDRHVYFTRDGRHLYDEDDREITDGATVADAQRQQRARPDATSYEEFVTQRDAYNQSVENAAKLREAAARLDDLDKRIKTGDLSPDELAEARRQQHDVIESLPADARREYEHLHNARQDANNLSYRADPAFAAAPDLINDFQRAGSIAAAKPNNDSQQQMDRPSLVYKAAPDF